MDGYIRPQSLQDYQNGSYTDETFDLFANVQNPDLSWDLNPINNESVAQSTSSHLNWPQSTGTNASLEAYGRPFSKSPSIAHAATNYGYGDPRQFSQSPYDPSLVPATTITDPSSVYASHAQYNQQPLPHGTISPQALQQGQSQSTRPMNNLESQGFSRNNTALKNDYARAVPSAPSVDQAALFASIPQGDVAGIFSIIDFERLVSASNTRRVSSFVDVGQQEFEYPINKAVVSIPARRKSRNELRALARNDPKLLAKLGKKHTKRTHSATTAEKVRKPGLPPKNWQPTPGIKYEDDSSSEDYSSSESDDYSEDELAEPSPLPPKRPDDPIDAVKYDSIKATWRSKRFELDSTDIRSGLSDFWEVVRTIRDRWKIDTAAVAEAEEKKKHGEIPLLKSRVKDQRNMFEAALRAAIQHGHRGIVELFGQNTAFLYVLYQYLLDRYNDKDYDGPLTRVILEVLSVCTTLSEENMDKTRLGRVYSRFGKLGNTETQAIVKRIDATVADYKKRRAESSANTSREAVVESTNRKDVKSPPSVRQTPEPVAGVKRAASGGTISNPPSKRVASGPASPAPPTTTASTKSATIAKRPVTNAAPAKPSTTTPSATTKPRSTLVKPTSVPSSSTGGVRKPVVAKPKAAPPSLVANALKSIEKKAAAPPAPAKPAFSFAETMANLTKPKQKEPTPKEEDKRPPETAEEKAKRVRKEQRRKLRVTFKPDHQLVQVRLFHHDVEEELGHDESMIRDVSDVGGEGRMFKQHKDMMDVDDDEEPGEESPRPYTVPNLTDFTDVDAEERKRNYVPYGGGELQPESPERIVREQYESNTLMAYDSPPCPREPEDPYNGENVVTKNFGTPDPQGVAAVRAARFIISPPVIQHQSAAGSAPDISAILAMITPQQSHQQTQQAPATTPPPASVQEPEKMSELQRILANLPPASQQQQPIPPQPSQNSVAPDIASILANLQTQGKGFPTAPLMQQPPLPSPAVGTLPDPSNLAAILGQLNQGQSNSGVAPPSSNFGQLAFPGHNYDAQNFGQGQQQNSAYENEERKRWREGGEDDGGNQQRKWAKKVINSKRFTLPCKYWGIGKCQKGSSCTYLHE